jgi:hypothetical protein
MPGPMGGTEAVEEGRAVVILVWLWVWAEPYGTGNIPGCGGMRTLEHKDGRSNVQNLRVAAVVAVILP